MFDYNRKFVRATALAVALTALGCQRAPLITPTSLGVDPAPEYTAPDGEAAIGRQTYGVLTTFSNRSSWGGPQAIFCNSTTKDLEIGGSRNEVKGDTHSNCGHRVGGSSNTVTGRAESCRDFHDGGSKNRYGSRPKGCVQDPPIGNDCSQHKADFTFHGDTRLEDHKECWIRPGVLKTGVYKCSGKLTLSTNKCEGKVTFVAEKIRITGSNCRLVPCKDGILCHAESREDEAVHVAGNENLLCGLLDCPNGQYRLSGYANSHYGCVISDSCKIDGSQNHVIFQDWGYCNGPKPRPTHPPCATPTPKPTAKPTATPTPKPTAKPTATPTPKPTAKPTATPTPHATATPTPRPTGGPSTHPTASPTATPTPTPVPMATPTPTPVPTPEPTATPVATPEPTPTPDPGGTPDPTPTPGGGDPTPTPTQPPASGSTWSFQGGGSPFAVAVDAAQHIWVTNDGNTVSVTKNDKAGQPLAQKIVGTNAHEVTIQPSNQRVWVTVHDDQRLFVFDQALTQVQQIITPGRPEGLAFDSNETAWMADESNGQVVAYDGATLAVKGTHSFNNFNARPRGLVLDAQDNVWVALNGTNQVAKITPQGTETRIATDANPSRLVVDGGGNVWVSCTGTDVDLLPPGATPGHTVMKINAACTTAQRIEVGQSPYGLSLDKAGNVLVVNTISNTMQRLDANTGAVLQTYGNLGPGGPNAHPYNVAVDNAGFAWVSLFLDNMLLKLWP
jgi:sugar lactone lactonase YvrE